MQLTQSEREKRELDFWKEDPDERPGVFSMNMIRIKFEEAGYFFDDLDAHLSRFASARVVLELGGGQCWASCIIKALYPEITVLASDISADAVEFASIWEKIFRVQLDQKFACRSYDIPLESSSVDLIFTFQAAHHFGNQADTLREAYRVLREDGVLLYLHEPGCSKLTYRQAYKRVNSIRPAVEEDLLVYSEMSRLAVANGFSLEIIHRCDLGKKGFMRVFYYKVLQLMPPLRKILPSTSDFVFLKK